MKKIFFGAIFLVMVVALISFLNTGTTKSSTITIPEVKNVTEEIQKSEPKTRVLVVPGHEPWIGGTNYKKVYERDMAAELGRYLQEFLNADHNYEAVITRDDDVWNPVFENYFENNWDSIEQWINDSREERVRLESMGMLEKVTPQVPHNKVEGEQRTRLYGITKWSNENDIDLMVHVHFNNYRRDNSVPGKYTGVVMYVPEKQLDNSSTTRAIAEIVLNRLGNYNPESNFPLESGGIIEDPNLIAVGSNNTSRAASMVIEYEYIYQPQFQDAELRSIILKDYAYQTFLGLQDYFYGTKEKYDPTMVYEWNDRSLNSKNIYALQTALLVAGYFPPDGDKIKCPRNGKLDNCTRNALAKFQKENGIRDEKEGIGPMTFELLRKIYTNNN